MKKKLNDTRRNSFPGFLTKWQEINGNDFTPTSYLNQEEGLPFAIAAAWLFVPDFIEYRGGIFRTELPHGMRLSDQAIINDWFVKLDDDVSAVERISNQLTLSDSFAAVDLTPYEDDLLQFANSIAKSWSALLAAQFPTIDFCVDVFEHDSVGPQVTFYRMVNDKKIV